MNKLEGKEVSDKIVIAISLLFLILLLFGVFYINKINKKQLTAEYIINQMKSENKNIGRIKVYNESTDPNKLMGKEHQYISKIDFEDIRLEQDGEYLKGGTIEVFKNKKDMNTRKEYIEGFASSPLLAEYIYSKDNILLRLDKELTQEQAEIYQELISNIK